MSKAINFDQSISLQVPRPTAGARVMKALMAVLPWSIIAGLLWAGLFIKPQPVGATVTPPALERRDQFYGLALAPTGDVWVSGSSGKILAIAENGDIRRLSTPTRHTLQDVAIWDAEHAVAVGNDGVILHSRDAGKQWQLTQEVPRSEIANKLYRVRVAPGGLAIATGEMGALLVSHDHGRSWKRLREEEDVAWNDVAILEGGRLVVVGEFGRILVSEDQGSSWEEVASPVPNSLMSVQFRDALNGVAIGLDGAVLVTRDGGRQWSAVDLGISDHLFDVVWDAAGGRWLASGALGRWVSGDAEGGDWKSGILDANNLAWHARLLPVGGSIWLAGADVGRWNGQNWSPVKP